MFADTPVRARSWGLEEGIRRLPHSLLSVFEAGTLPESPDSVSLS